MSDSTPCPNTLDPYHNCLNCDPSQALACSLNLNIRILPIISVKIFLLPPPGLNPPPVQINQPEQQILIRSWVIKLF